MLCENTSWKWSQNPIANSNTQWAMWVRNTFERAFAILCKFFFFRFLVYFMPSCQRLKCQSAHSTFSAKCQRRRNRQIYMIVHTYLTSQLHTHTINCFYVPMFCAEEKKKKPYICETINTLLLLLYLNCALAKNSRHARMRKMFPESNPRCSPISICIADAHTHTSHCCFRYFGLNCYTIDNGVAANCGVDLPVHMLVKINGWCRYPLCHLGGLCHIRANARIHRFFMYQCDCTLQIHTDQRHRIIYISAAYRVNERSFFFSALWTYFAYAVHSIEHRQQWTSENEIQ